MKANYHAFVTRMIQKYEGGYGWDKADPGGPTKYGITCYDLAAHRGQTMDSKERWAPIVHAMPLSDAEDIYAKKYAKGVMFDQLQSGVDCCMFDYGVNSGVGRAVKVARALVGMSDGTLMNAEVVQRVNAMDPTKFIKAMNAERLGFMHRIRGGSAWKTFGGGWQSRVDDLSAWCLKLATGWKAPIDNPPVQPATQKPAAPKAKVEVKPIGKDLTKTTTGVGGAGGGAWFLGVPPWVVALVVLVIVAGVFVYLIRRKNKAKAEMAVVLPSPAIIDVVARNSELGGPLPTDPGPNGEPPSERVGE